MYNLEDVLFKFASTSQLKFTRFSVTLIQDIMSAQSTLNVEKKKLKIMRIPSFFYVTIHFIIWSISFNQRLEQFSIKFKSQPVIVSVTYQCLLFEYSLSQSHALFWLFENPFSRKELFLATSLSGLFIFSLQSFPPQLCVSCSWERPMWALCTLPELDSYWLALVE